MVIVMVMMTMMMLRIKMLVTLMMKWPNSFDWDEICLF
jgi:hypothetical protein